ncbi:asparagine synthase (glutamine-hydrolyzing) [Longirhabdus pacifica]|uniref:asparagine synthase (glutamine-hydrolyzing) n=1 Tax=Longirhabdus pacifica TaxID=2305227 RepID=UPI00100878C9|nr:asparagine synthase (glutamine-hydrolyzing) [Longirhabdus pacifica]
MCGIVGILSNQKSVLEDVVRKAAVSLSHRGPDYQKTWMSDDNTIGLGHARLSIIDLVTGEQPISDYDEQIVITANGEFYDYERIQKDLKSRGHVFRTNSDSEIALHLYKEKGVACLEELRGEFAFIIWDQQKRRLFAARDRFGIKPLYYAIQDGVLYLASEVKALFAAGVKAEWDNEAYYQHLFFYKQMNRSLFKGVHQVPPGHFILATEDDIKVKEYWQHDYPIEENRMPDKKPQEYIEEVQEALHESIRIRLRSDVPVGFHLSGGVDSSTVLGISQQYSDDPLEAFTVTFDNEAYDEGKVAEETAGFVGANYNPLQLDFGDFADHVEKAVWHAETIGINMNGVARYLKSKILSEKGYRVVLTGDGADEIFAGYIFSRIDMFLQSVEGLDRDTKLKKLEQFLAENPSYNHLPTHHYLDHQLPTFQKELGFSPSWIQAVDVSRKPLQKMLSHHFLSEFQHYDIHRHFLDGVNVGELQGRNYLNQGMYIWNKSILPNQILFAERLDMSHGVEIRMPLLDHKLFELVRSFPTSMLIHQYKEKYVLREAAKPYLSPNVYQKPKQPFLAPPSTLQSNNKLHQLMQDMLRSDVMKQVPFFEQKQIIGLLDHLPNMPKNERIMTNTVLLLVLTTCILQDRLMNASELVKS